MTMSEIQVLLVEDNAADIRLTQEAFREADIHNKIHIVTDGASALAFMRKQAPYKDAPLPDLVLLDLNLPRKHGTDVLREIKQDPALRRIPVVILTTSRDESDVRRSYDLHANCYLVKPTAYEGFLETVYSIRDFWLSRAELPRHAH